MNEILLFFSAYHILELTWGFSRLALASVIYMHNVCNVIVNRVRPSIHRGGSFHWKDESFCGPHARMFLHTRNKCRLELFVGSLYVGDLKYMNI
jgi:hypothetical protein